MLPTMSVSGALQLQVEVDLFHQSLQLFSPAVPAAIATLASVQYTPSAQLMLPAATHPHTHATRTPHIHRAHHTHTTRTA